MNSGRKQNTFFLLTICLLITPSCVTRPHSTNHQSSINVTSSVGRININLASPEELSQLPGIGLALAERIVEHRAKHGPFRRPEHLMMVRGFGDRRVRALLERISVE